MLTLMPPSKSDRVNVKKILTKAQFEFRDLEMLNTF